MKIVFVHAVKHENEEGELEEKVIGEFDSILPPFAGAMVQFEEGDRTPQNLYICFNPIYELFGNEDPMQKVKVPVLTLEEHQRQLIAKQQEQHKAMQNNQSRIITPGA